MNSSKLGVEDDLEKKIVLDVVPSASRATNKVLVWCDSCLSASENHSSHLFQMRRVET